MTSKTIAWLNELPESDARAELAKCCAASWWVEKMVAARPFDSPDALHATADDLFDRMPHEAYREAFDSHPQIGDLESLKMRFAGNKQWSSGEQASVASATEEVLHRLREGNLAFKAKFGFVFLVCATGKSAAEMLAILERRLKNDPNEEFLQAAGEQRKITHLRLNKLEEKTP